MTPFVGVSQATLEIWLAELQEEIRTGKTRTKVGSEHLDVEFQVHTGPRARLRMILDALAKLDPVKYPPHVTRPINRTNIRFGH